MRGHLVDALSLAGLLAAGAGLMALAALAPDRFALVGAWMALSGFLLASLVALGSLRWKVTRTPGYLVLVAGLLLLAGSGAVPLVPLAAPLPGWLGGGDLPPGAAALLFLATGATGLAFGFVFWTNGLIRRAGGAEERTDRLGAEVAKLEDQLRAQAEQLRRALTVDDLTGVLNRRPFLERLDETIRRDARIGSPLAFLMVTVPSVHSLSARGARGDGDKALREVGQALQGATRGTDVVGRLGQDLFGVALGECVDPQPAVHRLLLAVAAAPRMGPEAEPIRVRVAGVTVARPSLTLTFTDLFARADALLSSLPADGPSRWARASLEADVPASTVAAGADGAVPNRC